MRGTKTSSRVKILGVSFNLSPPLGQISNFLPLKRISEFSCPFHAPQRQFSRSKRNAKTRKIIYRLALNLFKSNLPPMGFLHFRLRFVSRFYVSLPRTFQQFSIDFFLKFRFDCLRSHFIDFLTFNFIFTANSPKRHFSLCSPLALFIYLLACALWENKPIWGFAESP